MISLLQTFKTPYRNIGTTLALALLGFVSLVFTLVTLVAPLVTALLDVSLEDNALVVIRVVLYLLGILIVLYVLSRMARLFQRVAIERQFTYPPFSIKDFVVALALCLLGFIYYIVYILTLLVDDTPGIILSLFYLTLLAVFGPALFLRVCITQKFFAGFRWDLAVKHTLNLSYLVAWGLSLVTIVIYSLIHLGVSILLALPGSTGAGDVTYYILRAADIFQYVLLLIITWSTVGALFAQTFNSQNGKKSSESIT